MYLMVALFLSRNIEDGNAWTGGSSGAGGGSLGGFDEDSDDSLMDTVSRD
jgi:hypothetical protein